VCARNLRYPAYNVHAPYYQLCFVLLYNIFSTLSHKRHDFGYQLLNVKCVLLFSLQRLSETFLILRLTEQGMIKIVYWSSCKVPVVLVKGTSVAQWLRCCATIRKVAGSSEGRNGKRTRSQTDATGSRTISQLLTPCESGNQIGDTRPNL